MMEEIDRFQVPPVNGETQPLVRDEWRENAFYANNPIEYKRKHFSLLWVYLGGSHNLRVWANR